VVADDPLAGTLRSHVDEVIGQHQISGIQQVVETADARVT
jgi:hypothetical protein